MRGRGAHRVGGAGQGVVRLHVAKRQLQRVAGLAAGRPHADPAQPRVQKLLLGGQTALSWLPYKYIINLGFVMFSVGIQKHLELLRP